MLSGILGRFITIERIVILLLLFLLLWQYYRGEVLSGELLLEGTRLGECRDTSRSLVEQVGIQNDMIDRYEAETRELNGMLGELGEKLRESKVRVEERVKVIYTGPTISDRCEAFDVMYNFMKGEAETW